MTQSIQLLQPSINVSVDYYDEVEKKLLGKYLTAKNMADLVESGISIPTEEFLTYYLFYRQRLDKNGWRSYQDLGKRIGNAIADLEDWVAFDGCSIRTASDVSEQDKTISEHVGESIGLSVVSHLHGLSAADWERIPSTVFKAFDFSISSDGTQIIQVEAKGSCVEDNSKKCSSVSQHKKSIHDKKIDISKRTIAGTYKYPADIRYGTITAMDKKSVLKCWLVDPPSDSHDVSPYNYRLLQRMQFITDWVSFICPRAHFSSALQTRLKSLETIRDPSELDGVPLVRGNGEPYQFEQSGYRYQRISTLFNSKSKITNWNGLNAGGVVLPISHDKVFFAGIDENMVELAYRQKHNQLLGMMYDHVTSSQKVRCRLPTDVFEHLDVNTDIRSTAMKVENGKKMEFRATGNIHCSNSGIVFGILPVGDIQHKSR